MILWKMYGRRVFLITPKLSLPQGSFSKPRKVYSIDTFHRIIQSFQVISINPDFNSHYFKDEIMKLPESKLILSYTGLGNDQFVRISNVNIPRIIVWISILLALMLCVALEILIGMHNIKHGIAGALFPVAVSLSFVALILTYTTLVRKVDRIVRIMDYLENFANKSNELAKFCRTSL